ncbi:MAG: NFACT family protein [Evtepia gabavorous]
MGDKVRRRLVLEAMGRRTNLLLLDGEDRIVDCLRRVEGDLTQARPLLPGMFYQYPAPQPGKKNPGALTPADRTELLALGQGAGPADRSSWITAWACRPCWPGSWPLRPLARWTPR